MIYRQSPADDARNLIGRYALAALGAIGATCKVWVSGLREARANCR